MNAAIYARVSTTDQHNEIQVRELTEYVERRGWNLVAVYQDKMSGAKAKRPGLDAMSADARLNKFDVVLVLKLDRFGRSLMNCVAGIQELAAMGIRFIAVSQGLDTDESNPTSRLLLHILASVAEFERELICERVRAGVKNAKRNGTMLGRPKRIVRRDLIVERRDAGLSWRAIANEFGIAQATVRFIYNEQLPSRRSGCAVNLLAIGVGRCAKRSRLPPILTVCSKVKVFAHR